MLLDNYIYISISILTSSGLHNSKLSVTEMNLKHGYIFLTHIIWNAL